MSEHPEEFEKKSEYDMLRAWGFPPEQIAFDQDGTPIPAYLKDIKLMLDDESMVPHEQVLGQRRLYDEG